MVKCKYAEECNAPLCPLDKDIEKRIWYPDEPICKRRDFANLLFIQNQKKIAKRVIDRDTYYTYDMLNRRMKITRGMHGLNPDMDGSDKKAWFKKHKGISDEEHERLRKSALKNLVKH